MKINKKSSIVTKLMMIILLSIIPLNLFNVYSTSYNSKLTKQKIKVENQNILNLYINQIDTAINRSDEFWYRVIQKNTDFIWLSTKDPQTIDEVYEFERAIVSLKNYIHKQLEEINLIEGKYCYFLEKDIFITASSTSINVQNYIRDYGKIKIKQMNGIKNQWKIVELEDDTYLLKIYEKDDVICGSWFSLENSLKSLGLSQIGQHTLFCYADQNEKVYTNHPGLPQKISNKQEKIIIQDVEYEIIQGMTQNESLKMLQLVPYANIISQVPPIIQFFGMVAIVLCFTLPFVLFQLNRVVIVPLKQLTRIMKKIEDGEMNSRIEEASSTLEFSMLNKNFNHMLEQIQNLKIDVYEGKIERQKINLAYLNQQIQPHFILNSLNIIYSYEPKEYNLIQEMTLCLVQYFRYIVNINSEYIEVYRELEHIKNYFRIQEVRYPENFFSIVEAEEGTENTRIPPLIIQNFAENAIKYALKMGEKINIYILVRKAAEDKVKITIADTGKGFDDNTLAALEKFIQTRERSTYLGVGIPNVIERLDLIYQNKFEITFFNSERKGATVEIIIPYNK